MQPWPLCQVSGCRFKLEIVWGGAFGPGVVAVHLARQVQACFHDGRLSFAPEVFMGQIPHAVRVCVDCAFCVLECMQRRHGWAICRLEDGPVRSFRLRCQQALQCLCRLLLGVFSGLLVYLSQLFLFALDVCTQDGMRPGGGLVS